tara:strand:- start:1529 stop:1819 length:291 start_codon:yes stop_codon:yes gene_type:complete
MQSVNELLRKLANQIKESKLSPMERKQKKKEFVTKLGYRYLNYNKAKWFDYLYNSKKVAENKIVYYEAELLYNKYREEIDKWKDYKTKQRQKNFRS